MEIHILLAGQQIGPFTETQVREYLGQGLVTPSDLAFHEGMKEWQPLELILAHLPSSVPEPETISRNEKRPDLVELESASPPAEPVAPLTATQRLKRKLSKIVLQPILPLEATIPRRKKSRTVKMALTMQPLRSPRMLPPVTGPLPLGNFSESPIATPPLPRPPVSVVVVPEHSNAVPPPPLADPRPLENPGKSSVATALPRRIPRVIIYAAATLVFLLVCAILSVIYLISIYRGTPPADHVNELKNDLPLSSHAEMQISEVVPKTAADYSARGFARQAKGDLEGALQDYNQALGLDPKDVEAFYRRGLAHQAKGDLEGALADYNQVLSLDPKEADAYSNRGFIKQAKGDLDGALADYGQALLLNPKISIAYYNIGLIKVKKGDLDGAIVAYNHALDLDPKMAFAYYNRGNAKNSEGNLDGAIADYTQALTLNPKIALAYCNRGFARQSKGDSDGALADYAQALALNPKMAVAFYNRGLIKVGKGDLDGAMADSSQAIDLDPGNGQAYCNRGLARFGKGDLAGAMTDLRKFCELVPRDSGTDSARLYLWLISTEQNARDKADQELSTSLLNDWNSPPEDLISKIAAFLLGHMTESDLIANAASPDPSREPGQYCKVWYFAGMKRLLAGDKPTAIGYFQKGVATHQKDLCEYLFAQAELQALGQNNGTPSKPDSSP